MVCPRAATHSWRAASSELVTISPNEPLALLRKVRVTKKLSLSKNASLAERTKEARLPPRSASSQWDRQSNVVAFAGSSNREHTRLMSASLCSRSKPISRTLRETPPEANKSASSSRSKIAPTASNSARDGTLSSASAEAVFMSRHTANLAASAKLPCARSKSTTPAMAALSTTDGAAKPVQRARYACISPSSTQFPLTL